MYIYIYIIYIYIYIFKNVYNNKIFHVHFISQSSKKLLRKSAKTCDKSKKPKNTVIAPKFVNYTRSKLQYHQMYYH